MNKLNLLCVFASFFHCFLAGDVRVLTDNNFQDLISNEPVSLVKFFAPWCGHCKSIAPEFEKAATILKKNDPPVSLFEVDCTEAGKETCSKFEVNGYPMLKIFKNGVQTDDYQGPRDSAGIVKHMRSKAGPAYRELTTVAEVETMLTADQHIIIGFFDEADSESEKWFKSAADAAGSDYVFGYSHSAEVLSKYPYANKVMVYHPPHLVSKMEDNPRPYTGSLEVAALKTWLEDNVQGMCGHRKISNLDQFKRPLVIVYYDVDYVRNTKGTNYWRNRILKVAKKLREAGKDVTFAVSSATELAEEVESVGLKYDADKPVVAGRNEKDEKFVMTQEFSLEALEQFASDLVDKKLEAYLKSEPIPATNDEPVKVVVGKTFDQIVNDKTKDVLIEFYAPWCGHCKHLTPKYEELAEKLKDEPNIVIAKMDATANDVPQPFNVEGFPTIYFVPKDAKNSPQAYEGEREVKDFIKFIAREASEPLLGWDRDGKKKKAEKAEL